MKLDSIGSPAVHNQTCEHKISENEATDGRQIFLLHAFRHRRIRTGGIEYHLQCWDYHACYRLIGQIRGLFCNSQRNGPKFLSAGSHQ